MAVKRITRQEFDDRVDELIHGAGFDLEVEINRATRTDDRNPAKVIEHLENVARAARQVAQYLRDGGDL